MTFGRAFKLMSSKMSTCACLGFSGCRKAITTPPAKKRSRGVHPVGEHEHEHEHPVGVRSDAWSTEVCALREMLLKEYGPFLTRRRQSNDVEEEEEEEEGSRSTERRDAKPRHLVDLDSLIDAIERSREMSSRICTGDRAMHFIEWLSERTSTSSATSPAVRDTAREVARVHGLRGSLLLPSGPPWLFPSDLISTFERSVPEGETPKKKRKPRKAISTAVRNSVWNEWIGIEMGVGPCHCCGRQISQQDYECGHVIAASRGGTDFPDNLRPLCRACNRSMRDENLYEFKRRSGFGGGGGGDDPMDTDL